MSIKLWLLVDSEVCAVRSTCTHQTELILSGLQRLTVWLVASEGVKSPHKLMWWVASLCCFITREKQKMRQGLVCSFSLYFSSELTHQYSLHVLAHCFCVCRHMLWCWGVKFWKPSFSCRRVLFLWRIRWAGRILPPPAICWLASGRGKEQNKIRLLSPFCVWEPWQSGPILKEPQGIQLYVILMFLNSISLEMK